MCPAAAPLTGRPYAEAATAADEILGFVFGLVPARKDDRNILTREGFDRALRAITRELLLVVGAADRVALQKCLQALDTNWKGLSPDERDAAVARAAAVFGGVPDVIVTPVTQALSKVGQHVVTQAKDAAAAPHGLSISPAFDLVDMNVIKPAATSQALFVRDEYGRRVERASQRAREVVAGGLERGLDKHDIGRELEAAMEHIQVDRPRAYWRLGGWC